MEIDPKDIEITTCRGSGPGGQHRNTTDSAVRIRHLPTGIVVTASESRSQHANRQKAMERLRLRLAALNRRRKRRIPTAPGKAAVERRLKEKARRSGLKKGRAPVED